MPPDTPLADTVLEIIQKRLGVTGVIDTHGELIGIVTDGDLRRGLQRGGEIHRLSARDLMTANPKTIEPDALAARALADDGTAQHHLAVRPRPGHRASRVGVVHLHDILKAGVA